MKLAIIIVVVVVALIVIAIALFAALGKRQYQRYKGLERQRGSAHEARKAGVTRLDEANQKLLRAQRALVDNGRHADAEEVERIRRRLVTATDRHRYTSQGYAPLASDAPVRESELAELQVRDAELVGDSEIVLVAADDVEARSRSEGKLDVSALAAAVDELTHALDRRKALT
jgi:hypothetical protein